MLYWIIKLENLDFKVDSVMAHACEETDICWMEDNEGCGLGSDCHSCSYVDSIRVVPPPVEEEEGEDLHEARHLFKHFYQLMMVRNVPCEDMILLFS